MFDRQHGLGLLLPKDVDCIPILPSFPRKREPSGVRQTIATPPTTLDPRPDESGQHRGRRRLSKRGHPEWRRLLIAAAMSAARTKVWRDYVTLQRAKALPATAVHVILARKMLRTAFALFKNGQEFIPPRVRPT